jgi:hypothetical protein
MALYNLAVHRRKLLLGNAIHEASCGAQLIESHEKY